MTNVDSTTTKKGGLHYAWIVLVGCSLMAGGSAGIIYNAAGIFFHPITSELGFTTTKLAFWFMANGLAMVVALPFVGSTLPKVNVRVILTAAGAIVLTAYAAMSFYHQAWQWWISGAIIGSAGAFIMFVPIPVILSQWFAKRTGMAIGIAMSFMGITPAILNPVLTNFINTIGWRPTYLIAAAIGAVMVFPSTIFLIRFKPADKGLKPYGYEEGAEAAAPVSHHGASATSGATDGQPKRGITVKKALASPAFYILMISFAFMTLVAGVGQLLPSFASSVFSVSMGAKEAAIFGSTMVSVSLISNILFKLIFGGASDKLGALPSSLVTLAIIVTAFLVLYFTGGSATLALIGAALVGVAPAFYSVGTPIVVRAIFGDLDYAKIYSYLSMGVNVAGAFTLPTMAFMAQTFHFANTFLIAAGVIVFVIFALTFAFQLSKKFNRQPEMV